MEPVWQNQGAADIAVSIFQLSTIPRIPSFLLNAPVCNHHHHRNRSQNHMMLKLHIVDMYARGDQITLAMAFGMV